MLVNAVSMGAFPPLLPEVGSAKGLSDWQLGFLAGSFGLARTIADIPVGLFVRRDLRRALLIAPLGLITGAVCLASAGPFPVLVFGRAMMGVGHALAIVAGLTAILQCRAIGRLAGSLNAFEFSAIVGMLGGIMLVGTLPASLGWNVVYLSACGPLVIGLALVPSVLRSLATLDPAATAPSETSRRNPLRRERRRTEPRLSRQAANAAETSAPAAGAAATIRDPAGVTSGSDPAATRPATVERSAAAAVVASRDTADRSPRTVPPRVALAVAAGAIVAFCYSMLEQFVIPLRGSREFRLDRGGIARLLAIAQVCDLLLLLPVGALADRLRPARVLGPVLLLLAAAVVAITFGGFTLVLLGCALFGVGMAGWMLPLGLLRQETPAQLVAWRTAVYRVGVDGCLFLGPFVSGLFGEQRVGWLAATFAAALIGTAAMVFRGRGRSPGHTSE